MYGLVDCESFYASCERIFRPDLYQRPIAVLSNNDGCLIALSKELKEIGFAIGAPYFKNRTQLKKLNVAVFSANFALYGDISARIMESLKACVAQVEVYSIDEAFFVINHQDHVSQYISNLRQTLIQWHGVPVRIGIAPTKTLAKVANFLAKKSPDGTYCILSPAAIEHALTHTPIAKVWGIGKAHSRRLGTQGVTTALEFRQLPPAWVQKNMGVTGLRTQQEMFGQPCIELERIPVRKSIIHSRTFPQTVTELATLQSHIREYLARAAERLRSYNLRAGVVNLSLATNRHGRGAYHAHGCSLSLPHRSSNTMLLNNCVTTLLQKLYNEDYGYKRASITLLDLADDSQAQLAINAHVRPEQDRLWQAVDQLNARFGRNTVSCGYRRWRPRQNLLSPQYTTRVADICQIN